MDPKRIDFARKKTDLDEYDKILWELREELRVVSHETLMECVKLAKLSGVPNSDSRKTSRDVSETVDSLLRESKDENVQRLLAIVRSLQDFAGDETEG